jgi:hypothetical protein
MIRKFKKLVGNYVDIFLYNISIKNRIKILEDEE